jgi:hypothetical protein
MSQKATASEPPTRRERTETERAISLYTDTSTSGGLAIRWANLTESEARRLVDLTKAGDRSTRRWWPLVLRAAGMRRSFS